MDKRKNLDTHLWKDTVIKAVTIRVSTANNQIQLCDNQRHCKARGVLPILIFIQNIFAFHILKTCAYR